MHCLAVEYYYIARVVVRHTNEVTYPCDMHDHYSLHIKPQSHRLTTMLRPKNVGIVGRS